MPPAFWKTLKGKLDINVVIPATDQWPSAFLASPFDGAGRSWTYVKIQRCLTSKSDKPRPASGRNWLAEVPPRSKSNPPESLSSDFEKVYAGLEITLAGPMRHRHQQAVV
jgi:hypothetical protein